MDCPRLAFALDMSDLCQTLHPVPLSSVNFRSQTNGGNNVLGCEISELLNAADSRKQSRGLVCEDHIDRILHNKLSQPVNALPAWMCPRIGFFTLVQYGH